MDPIWNRLSLNYGDEDLIDLAVDRGLRLERLLKLVLTYEEAMREGHTTGLVLDLLFKAAKELKS